MMFKRLLIAFLLCCISLIFTGCNAEYGNNIIKTELTDGEVVPHVKLSDGELWFKTLDDIYAQFTQEDYTFASKRSDLYFGEEIRVPYYRLNGNHTISLAEMASTMNIHPESWVIPNNDGRNWTVFYLEPFFAFGDKNKLFFADPDEGLMCGYLYNFRYVRPGVDIYIGPVAQVWLPRSQIASVASNVDFGLEVIRKKFGDLDSTIGSTALSIRQDALNLEAFMTVGNASYQISVNRDVMSQREFIELLISICEVPRENTQDVVEYILEHG